MVLKKRFFWVLLIVSLVLLAGCPVPEARPEEPAHEEPAPVVNQEPTPAITAVSSEVVQGLKLELSVPKVKFRPGETVIATLSLINTTPETISLSSMTSQLFDLIIEGPGRERRWSDDRMFLQVITPHEIPANETLSRSLAMDNIGRGEIYLVGVTVSLHLRDPLLDDLPGEEVQFRTPPLRIEIGGS